MTSHLITYWQARFRAPKLCGWTFPENTENGIFCVQIRIKLCSSMEVPTMSR
jgi:hypothetical protein